MKLIVIHATGLLTEPQEALQGRALLEAARTDALDELARYGSCGTVTLLPEGMVGGAGAEALAVLGALDEGPDMPSLGVLEALGVDVPLYARDVAFRVNLASVDEDGVITDTSGAGIPEADALSLMREVDERLSTRWRKFYPGRYFAHLMVWTDGPIDTACVPAPLACGNPVAEALPVGDGDGPLCQFIWDTLELLNDHRINHVRREEGLPPVNCVWPWAPGRLPDYRDFALRTGLRAKFLASRLEVLGAAKALGIRAGAPGAAPSAMAAAVVSSAAEASLSYLHADLRELFEHPTEAEAHVDAVERLDTDLIAPVLSEVRAAAEATRLVVLATGPEGRWVERPPALWGALPPLVGREASTDVFTEDALRVEGLPVPEPSQLLRETLGD